jgi:hypothetical protein
MDSVPSLLPKIRPHLINPRQSGSLLHRHATQSCRKLTQLYTPPRGSTRVQTQLPFGRGRYFAPHLWWSSGRGFKARRANNQAFHVRSFVTVFVTEDTTPKGPVIFRRVFSGCRDVADSGV